MTVPSARDWGPLEQRVLSAFDANDQRLATTLLLEGYGPDVFRLLSTLHRNEDDADEVFSLFAEAIWRAAPTFERRCSVRTWAYAIARLTSLRFRRDTRRRVARFTPFPEGSEFSELEARVRSETRSYLRTERRTKLVALRDALPPDDRILLILRVDQQLSWEELALVLHQGEGGTLAGADLKRKAARLRKRFQALKEKLREAGRRAGLIGSRKQ